MLDNFTVKVPGLDFELSSNATYHVREVADNQAPDGFQKAGISKHPLMGIEQNIIIPYHENTSSWNTGLNASSYCYAGMPKKQVDITLKTLEEKLIPQLQVLVENDITDIKSSNNELFDDFPPFSSKYGKDTSQYKIKGGNMYDTSNVLEFIALFWALIGKQIIPPGVKNTAVYKNCPFILEDKKKTTSVRQDSEFEKTAAKSKVFMVLQNKKVSEVKYLNDVFTYVGFKGNTEEVGVKPLISMFDQWCDQNGHNNDNAILFNEVYDNFDTKKGKEELIVYSKLLEYIKEGKIEIERSELIMEGTVLGTDKKRAAAKIISDQELHKKFLSL